MNIYMKTALATASALAAYIYVDRSAYGDGFEEGFQKGLKEMSGDRPTSGMGVPTPTKSGVKKDGPLSVAVAETMRSTPQTRGSKRGIK